LETNIRTRTSPRAVPKSPHESHEIWHSMHVRHNRQRWRWTTDMYKTKRLGLVLTPAEKAAGVKMTQVEGVCPRAPWCRDSSVRPPTSEECGRQTSRHIPSSTSGRCNMAEHKIVPVCTVIDLEERKRRLSRVYTILLDLAAQKESGEPTNVIVGRVPATASTEWPSRVFSIPTPPLANGVPASGGGPAHPDSQFPRPPPDPQCRSRG
jgi:hypothetical protein